MATLLFKVGSLTLKTLSKPLAAKFEGYVMQHPVLRNRVINLAQRLHRMEVGINRGAEGKTSRAFVGDMSEEKALQLASKVVSEGFLYTIAVGLLVLEMDRKRREDRVKRTKDLADREAARVLHDGHTNAEQELSRQQQEMAEMLRRIDERLQKMEEGSGSGRKRPRWALL